MEKKELNLSYLFEETIKKAYEKKDCLFLARLILRIMEQNPEIKLNVDLKTLDWIIYDRLEKTLSDIDYEQNVQEEFSNVSEGYLSFLEFVIERKRKGKL